LRAAALARSRARPIQDQIAFTRPPNTSSLALTLPTFLFSRDYVKLHLDPIFAFRFLHLRHLELLGDDGLSHDELGAAARRPRR
jgi:hypothetical protein